MCRSRLSLRLHLLQMPGRALWLRSWQILKSLTRAGLQPTSKTLYRRAPTWLLSRLMGVLMGLALPHWLQHPLLGLYVWAFSINMAEAAEEDLSGFRSLGELFQHSLKPWGAPSPPMTWSAQQMAGSCTRAACGGAACRSLSSRWHPRHRLYHCVIYLALGDYHRFHSPTDWHIQHHRHFPGSLMSVSPSMACWIPELFCHNERVVLSREWAHGFFSLTAVGATNVGSMHIYCGQDLCTNCARHVQGCYHDHSTRPGWGQLGSPSPRGLAWENSIWAPPSSSSSRGPSALASASVLGTGCGWGRCWAEEHSLISRGYPDSLGRLEDPFTATGESPLTCGTRETPISDGRIGSLFSGGKGGIPIPIAPPNFCWGTGWL